VIAYRQPVTIPEIEEIRGVDSGGVIHTLLEKKLVVTSGRKSVVGRPILYRTSKDFLVHFGLKDVGELPSLKEFEELAKRALGAEWGDGEAPAEASGATAPAAGAEAGPAAVDAAPATPPEASQPLAAETAPPETQAASEAPPARTEEADAVSVEAPVEPPQEVPPTVVERTTQAETPAAPATEETASASESVAAPEAHEPKD